MRFLYHAPNVVQLGARQGCALGECSKIPLHVWPIEYPTLLTINIHTTNLFTIFINGKGKLQPKIKYVTDSWYDLVLCYLSHCRTLRYNLLDILHRIGIAIHINISIVFLRYLGHF